MQKAVWRDSYYYLMRHAKNISPFVNVRKWHNWQVQVIERSLGWLVNINSWLIIGHGSSVFLTRLDAN